MIVGIIIAHAVFVLASLGFLVAALLVHQQQAWESATLRLVVQMNAVRMAEVKYAIARAELDKRLWFGRHYDPDPTALRIEVYDPASSWGMVHRIGAHEIQQAKGAGAVFHLVSSNVMLMCKEIVRKAGSICGNTCRP